MRTQQLLHKVLILCTTCILTLSPGPAGAQSSELAVVATLYSNGHPQSAIQGEIEGVAAFEKLLITSFRYFTDPEVERLDELHVWNVANPAAPVFVGVTQFRGPLENSGEHLNVPRDLTVIRGHLVFWSGNRIYTHRINADGSLTQVASESFADDLNPEGTGTLSYGGVHASTLRTMLTNNEFLQLLDEDRLSDYALINLQDPTRPFLETLNRAVGKDLLFLDNPINGSYNGLPASIALTQDELTLEIATFARRRATHFARFWRAPLRAVFNRGNLSRSLDRLATQITSSVKPDTLSTTLYSRFYRKLGVGGSYDLADLISANYAADAPLSAILADYGIAVTDTGRLAIEKISEKVVRAVFRSELQSLFGAKILEALHDAVFGVSTRTVRKTIGALQDEFSSTMKRVGFEKYLVDAVLAPLVDDTPFLRLTLGGLIKRVGETEFAAAIDGALAAFHRFFPLDAIEDGLPFDFPDCARVPRSTVAFLRQLLIKSGPRLNQNNPALFELLKLVDYYAGDGAYKKLTSTLSAALRDLHLNLATDFVNVSLATVNPFAAVNKSLASAFSVAAQSLNLERALAVTMADELSKIMLPLGIDTSLSVRTILEAQGLYIDAARVPFGGSLATAATLGAAIERLGLSATTVEVLLRRAGQAGGAEITRTGTAIVTKLFGDIFGDLPADATLESALENLVTSKMGAKNFAALISAQLGSTLTRLADGVSLPSVLGNVKLIARGDCIAQYQLALVLAQAAAAESVVFSPFVQALSSASLNLTVAYEKGLEFVLSTLLQQFLTSILTESVGSYPSWFARPTAQATTIQVASVLDAPARFVTPFISGKHVILVATNATPNGRFGENPAVSVITFDPLSVVATRRVTSLGEWYAVNNVEQRGSLVLVQGDLLIGGLPTPVTRILRVDNGVVTSVKTIAGSAAEMIAYAGDMTPLFGGTLIAATDLIGRVHLIQTGAE